MRKLLTDLTVVLCASAALALGQESAAPSAPAGRSSQEDRANLTEVERLRGENLRLKLDSLDKQMRLMQEQYARLQEAQQQLVRQLQALDEEILRERALPSAVWRVDWQTGKLERTPPGNPIEMAFPGDTEEKEK
ncbi:MAG: hypothetical protein ACRD88_16505 [Terriglobia bacterium]